MFHLEPISAWLTACGERAAIQRSSYATVVSNDHARGAASERARWSHQARHACKFVGSRHVTSSAVAQPRPPKVLTQPLESQSCLCLHPRGAETSGCFAFFNKCCSSCHLPLTIEWLDCDVATSKTNHHVNLRRSLCFSDVSASIAGLLVAGKWVGERGNFQRSILQSKLYQVAAVAHGVIPLLQCPARNGPLADPEICHAGTPQGGRQPVPSSTQAHWAHARRMRAQCGSDKAFDTKF
jgi:hypothetical protein